MSATKWVQISHDGFARQFTMRRVVEPVPGGCAWCGQLNGYGSLFQYGTEPEDSSRLNPHQGLFCSKSCHDSYHG
jgi:hypothetical protein